MTELITNTKRLTSLVHGWMFTICILMLTFTKPLCNANLDVKYCDIGEMLLL